MTDGTEHDPPHAFRQPHLDGFQRPDAAAKLYRQVGRAKDRIDRVAIHRFTRKGAVEIDHMQPCRPRRREGRRLRARVVAEHRRLVHVALAQAHALPVFQVDRRIEDHAPSPSSLRSLL